MSFVVPDKVVAEVGWRTWRLTSDNLLRSCNYRTSEPWEPGEPLAAECFAETKSEQRWMLMGIEEAIELSLPLSREWEAPRRSRDDEVDYATEGPLRPRPPRVELPNELTYAWTTPVPEEHVAPHASCTCGIYAAHRPDQCAGYGKYVVGRVSLWGSVVPGDKGWRAELAYPAELFVLKQPMPEHRSSMSMWLSFSMTPEETKPSSDVIGALEAYGVPVHHVENLAQAKKLVCA